MSIKVDKMRWDKNNKKVSKLLKSSKKSIKLGRVI